MAGQETYNYERFDPRFFAFDSFPGPRAGEPFPKVTVQDSDGNAVTLPSGSGRWMVLETGSITCPMYVKNARTMNDLVREYPDVDFVVLYVREAHPGAATPAHKEISEKRRRAGRLHKAEHEGRRVLVDDVNGAVHQAIGSFPNLTYVLDPKGKVFFRCDWNNPEAVAQALEQRAGGKAISRDHFEPAKPKPWTALRVLLRGGGGAVWDFFSTLPRLLRMHRAVRDVTEMKRD